MDTNKTSAICPHCGAQGTAGKFCEYCGTEIPMPIAKVKQDDDNAPFSWYNVIPQGYKISEDNVVGDSSHSLFMVVEADRDNSKLKGVINRKGKFIVDCNNRSVYLFADTNYCIIKYDLRTPTKLQNLQNGEVIYSTTNRFEHINPLWNSSSNVAIIEDNDTRVFSLYDTQNGEYISLPPEIAYTDTTTNISACGVRGADNQIEIWRNEENSNGEKKNTTWQTKLCNGTIEIINKEEKIENKNSGTGCLLVFLVPLLLPLALLYLL